MHFSIRTYFTKPKKKLLKKIYIFLIIIVHFYDLKVTVTIKKTFLIKILNKIN